MVSRRLQACFQEVSKHSVHLFWSFDCSASLRAHSRAGAPTGPSAASLRARASCLPRSTAPLRSALASWAGAPTGPSAAPLRSAPRVFPLDCFACAARSRLGWRPDWSLGCSASLRASCLPRSTAPLRSALAPGLAPRLVPRLLRFAARLVSSPLDCSAALRARAWAGAPDWPFGCFASLRASCLPRSTAPLRSALASWAGAPTGPSAASLRFAPRVFPRSTASLRSALAPGLAPPTGPSAVCFASRFRVFPLRARAWAGAPTAPSSAPLRFARAWLSTLACEISQAAGLCYAGVRSGARYVVHAPSIPDLSAKELASA